MKIVVAAGSRCTNPQHETTTTQTAGGPVVTRCECGKTWSTR